MSARDLTALKAARLRLAVVENACDDAAAACKPLPAGTPAWVEWQGISLVCAHEAGRLRQLTWRLERRVRAA